MIHDGRTKGIRIFRTKRIAMMARPMQTYSTMVGWHAPFYENTFLVQNQLIVDDNYNFLFYRFFNVSAPFRIAYEGETPKA